MLARHFYGPTRGPDARIITACVAQGENLIKTRARITPKGPCVNITC